MRQILLATALFIAPVAIFTGFHMVTNASAAVTSGLGDLQPFTTIVTDIQKLSTAGDLKGAIARANDWESAWDHGQTAIRPLNTEYWGNIDAGSDAMLSAVRAASPSPAEVNASITALLAVLNDPSKPAP